MDKINTITTIPDRLTVIPDAPVRLWVRGQLPEQSRPTVAIVGTRKPTAYGRMITESIATKLANRGIVIVSGLAHGVDAVAHQACLKARGTTVAVLPCGLDRIYPAAHRTLAESIIQHGGALLSDYEPGTGVMQYRLLQRNRLVIGLADALIITEASLRSGTMNTAGHALAQGKDVYVVPGNITSPQSAGCNNLIAQGAVPITDVDGFVETIAPRMTTAHTHMAFTTNERLILDLLGQGIVDGDIIQQKSGLDQATYLQTITMLELTGVIRPGGGNMWSL